MPSYIIEVSLLVKLKNISSCFTTLLLHDGLESLDNARQLSKYDFLAQANHIQVKNG